VKPGNESTIPNFSAPTPSGRYVVLLHRNPNAPPRPYRKDEPAPIDNNLVNNNLGDDHYDWLFESHGCLATWATRDYLPTDTDGEVTGLRLPDHRTMYLDYEGSVSGNRGSVQRAEVGAFELIDSSQDHYQIRTRGQRDGVLNLYLTWCGDGVSFWRISFSRSTDGTPTRADAN
jgi:hypothetical protein